MSGDMKRYLYLLVSFAFFAMNLSASSLSNEQKRIMYNDVLQLLNDYEEYSSMLAADYADMFFNLFESGESKVFNDIMSAGGTETVSVKEYCQLLSEEVAPGCRLFLTNVKHGEPVSADSASWTIPITFGKSSLYFDECDIRYSSKDYYASEYEICMTVLWNSRNGECLIREISGKMNSDVSHLPDGFVILRRTDDVRNELLQLNGQPLQWDNADICYLDRNVVTDKDILVFPDNDVELKLSQDSVCSRILKLKYKPKRWRFGVYYSGIKAPKPLSCSMDGRIGTSFSGTEIGAEIGHTFKSSRKTKVGIYTGVGLSNYTMVSDMPEMSYCYKASANEDIDGDVYYRYYSIRNLKYTSSVVDVKVPLYFDLDFRLSDIVHMYLDAGVEAYFNSKQNVEDLSAEYSTYGIYPDYHNLRIDAATLAEMGTSMNGFLENGKLSVADIEDQSIGLATFTLDAVAGLGLRFYLARSVNVLKDMALGIGVNYHYGLINYRDGKKTLDVNLENPSASNTSPRDNVPVNYSVSAGEKIVNVSHYISDLSRSGVLSGKISITYRF